IDARYIAVTFKDVIVMSPSDGGSKLERIDPAKHRVIGAPHPFKAAPTDLDPDGDGAAELSALPPTLTTWQPGLGSRQDLKVPTDGIPAELLKAGDGWATDIEANTLVRFDLFDGKLKGKFPMPLKPNGLAEDGDIIWVACESGAVQRVSEKT